MFRTALFIITTKQEQSKCSSVNGDKQMWYIHTMRYYLIRKRNELMAYTTMWMILENTALSERNQTHKTLCCMIPFIRNVWNRHT